jgi:hypothetical protein
MPNQVEHKGSVNALKNFVVGALPVHIIVPGVLGKISFTLAAPVLFHGQLRVP